jgi:hypothetical protein
MARWTKVALLACLICASSLGIAERSTSAVAKSSADSTSELSCLWFKGKRKWCLAPWKDGYCEVETYFGEDERNRLIVYNQKEEILGYLRPNGPGTWRAMILYGGIGWARDGRVARASRGRYFIFSGGRRRGIARGPRALEVAAYRLIYREDCSGWNQ